MDVDLERPWTIEKFLAWEKTQELRYEFDGFRPIAMTGGTQEHDAIQVSLVAQLYNRLQGKPCRVRGNSLKIQVMGSIRYPDAFITCGPIKRASLIAPDPVIVFEILSRGTARTDRTTKNREYASTASIQRYFMLEQAAIDGTMFARTGPNGAWRGEVLGPNAILAMPEAGIELPLADIYRDIDFENIDSAELDET